MADVKIVPEVKKLLCELADTYETRDFSSGDPSLILRRYRSARDTEVAAFITAMLSFGKREQFLQKVQTIFASAGKHPASWIQSGMWQNDFPRGNRKFYRFFSYDDMCDLFTALQNILAEHASFGVYVKKAYEAECAVRREVYRSEAVLDVTAGTKDIDRTESRRTVFAVGGIKSVNCTESEHNVSAAGIKLASCKLNKKSESGKPSVTGIKAANRKTRQTESFDASSAILHVIAGAFPQCRVVPQNAGSANKRMNMFLRWMVRTGSPVDIGLWTWFSPADLVMPLDTHVLKQAKKLRLISERSAGTEKTARELTRALKQIWPDDPCRGDFALFGLGVLPEYASTTFSE
ncbi:TIGR02757 family protein [Treponema sp. Marseille-Q4523]|uniref:TIGR02757 family protein n=1 Tax=Treponema sp. Marseille-Q4523 TaxID=2810610 RepID=UPI00196086CA|nr:TIGR02757 family protein [Treponema sp. Marseille-Q4523]MBM7023876.1 TIGR02757 family protein [Treponema sp. Marseille-Q4523]